MHGEIDLDNARLAGDRSRSAIAKNAARHERFRLRHRRTPAVLAELLARRLAVARRPAGESEASQVSANVEARSLKMVVRIKHKVNRFDSARPKFLPEPNGWEATGAPRTGQPAMHMV